MPEKSHHYATDAAKLLEACLVRLRETLKLDSRQRYEALYDMEDALMTTEGMLHAYFVQLLDLEHGSMAETEATVLDAIPTTLAESIQALQVLLETRNRQKVQQAQQQKKSARRPSNKKKPRCTVAAWHKRHAKPGSSFPTSFSTALQMNESDDSAIPQDQSAGDSSFGPSPQCYYPSRSATDSLLFRLIVALQLCLVRIDVAHNVIRGHRPGDHLPRDATLQRLSIGVAGLTCLGIGSRWLLWKPLKSRLDGCCLWKLTGKLVIVTILGRALHERWNNHWMSTKILNSTAALEEWQRQWMVVQCTRHDGPRTVSAGETPTTGVSSTQDAKSQRLIDYVLKQSAKSSFWHSEGEIRFLILKRAMDLLYASVGTAVEVTKSTSNTNERGPTWQMSLAAAAAASYYSITGPSRKASEAVSSSSPDLIQYAWGMVSLPAIKQLSLNASRLLKGAAVAERITIAGVHCFILSREPDLELSAALQRFHRRQKRCEMRRLDTIDEKTEIGQCPIEHPMLRRVCHKKDVIFHLTGGGFFAHTIASDLPYLLDWSGKANAIVICPEYALLPEHTYPVALDQVVDVYCSLLNGDAASLLGFDVRRIVVTGESAGGNLAAALCVKLCFDHVVDVDAILAERENTNARSTRIEGATDMSLPSRTCELDDESCHASIRLPDAIMLSCPALNLSLELSPSRIMGNQDPVLPTGLISAISDAYLPRRLGVSKKDPLASPFYAPDDVLRLFPPTLLFASSDDPLLDDSVDFNKRLRMLGVESDLRAAHHMPHAYWGLGTAGFPEAQQVQHECEEWLVRQFSRD